MKKKQFAAFLLSGLLVLNTAIPAFAEGMTEQTAETYKVDTTAPVVTAVSLDKTTANAGETLTLSIKASDDVSGVDGFQAIFRNEKTGEEIWSHHSDDDFGNPLETTMEISEYEESGTYELLSVTVIDNANNSRVYHKNPTPGYEEELPNPLSFTVINDNNNVIPPVKPERPSKPSHSGSSSGTVVNYDSEKPDPADKKATEMYDFWQNVKRKIKNTEEGKTLRVAVPAEYTYMPASVMETLRLNPQVSLKLSWGKDTIVIKAGTAQPKQKLKAYWTKSALVKLYSQR